ncbi:hypothetical protein KO505_04490 [Psychrosphaera sp. F3M07]|uniref:hypothetical protein n=1 Tax=Psychrosphaera sp. F3M07 TaxID=2841560 RepID=UPI001C084B7B|nr:hypothetical protein [Psychrosphaera sp. F3M07]MBU2917223.1 hypothetical protein [Psychrosphaera sp. F3M07]
MNYRHLINIILIILLFILGGIMSVIWTGEQSPAMLKIIISNVIDIPKAASGMNSPPEQYFYFGHFTLLFYVAIFFNIHSIKKTFPSHIVFISRLLLSIAFCADIGTYWLSEIYGTNFRAIAFWYIEFPALSLLIIYWIGLASYQTIKTRKLHKMIWLLPLAAIFSGIIQYLPHSLLLAILCVVSFRR